ncbi:MAG: hypothetical protein KY410_09930 [Proteobacteria bacterium]|nr:hypothetical protein [Pseudomonadota bacterium]
MMERTRKHAVSGKCHCGNIRYTLHTDTSPPDITLRICRCDFCLRHRPRYWSDSEGNLDISIKEPQNIQRYRFGHGTADFVLCRNCGVFAFAITATDAGYRAVTNLNLALTKDDPLLETFIEALTETEDERNRRRSRNWTPVSSGWPLP